MTSDSSLTLSTPSAEGTDAAGIAALVDALERDPAQEPHTLVVVRHGRVIARAAWAPYSADRPQLVYSLSKSFASAAAGLLFDAGELELDAPVITYFPEWADDIVDERSRGVLVRHVAAMAAGHREEMLGAALEKDPAEPVRGFLLHRPDAEPGTLFAYSQPNTYTLAAIVQKLRGRGLVEVLREGLLDPIGATDPLSWQEYPAGRAIGYSGAFVTADTAARLGQLLLRRGEWNGTRVLSEQWIEQAASKQVETTTDARTGASDWELGYGFQHWIGRHGFRGDGAYGQYCLVLPEHDAVVAYQGATEDLQGTLNHVWEHLLPAFGRAGSTAADAALAERLAGAQLPPLRVAAADDAGWPDGWEEGWDAARLAESDGPGRARVERDGDAWRLVLTGSTGDVAAAFAPGSDGWIVTEAGTDGSPAMAVSGGFASPERLDLDVSFIETPHRLHLELERGESGGSGVLRARWYTTPLSDPYDLFDLAAPRPFG